MLRVRLLKKAALNANYYKTASFLPLDGATLHSYREKEFYPLTMMRIYTHSSI